MSKIELSFNLPPCSTHSLLPLQLIPAQLSKLLRLTAGHHSWLLSFLKNTVNSPFTNFLELYCQSMVPISTAVTLVQSSTTWLASWLVSICLPLLPYHLILGSSQCDSFKMKIRSCHFSVQNQAVFTLDYTWYLLTCIFVNVCVCVCVWVGKGGQRSMCLECTKKKDGRGWCQRSHEESDYVGFIWHCKDFGFFFEWERSHWRVLGGGMTRSGSLLTGALWLLCWDWMGGRRVGDQRGGYCGHLVGVWWWLGPGWWPWSWWEVSGS